MPKRSAVASLTVGLVVLGLVGASAQPTWLMRYKWTEGQSITWLLDMEAGGQVTTRDMNADPPKPTIMDITSTMTMPQYQTVETVDADGNATVLTEMGPMEMDLTLPLVGTQHATLDPKTGKATFAGNDMPLPESMKNFMGKPIKQVLSPRGEVLEMELPFRLEDLVELGSTAPVQALKAMQQQPMVFPEQAIALGYCWLNERDLTPPATEEGEAPELPPITQTLTYKLAGFEDVAGSECARIELLGVMEIAGTLTMPLQAPNQEGTTKVGPAHFSISGTIWFDREAGQPLKMEVTMLLDVMQEVEGTVTVEEKTQDFHVQVELRDFEILLSAVRAEEG